MNKLTIIVLLLALNTSACTLLYAPDIQQGNVVTNEMLDKLKIGMDTKQVIFILGTPLIKDPFHKNRWDYFYSYKDNVAGTFKKSHVSVLFADGKMIRFNVTPKRTKENAVDHEIIIKSEIHDKNEPMQGHGGSGHGH